MNRNFIHLHLHTSYSLHDGACRPEDVVQAAIDNEMPAVAITDHGVMYGVVEFYKAARRRGIRPIIGCEVYVARRSRLMRTNEEAGIAPPHHLILLAETDQGYLNLMQLVTSSHLEGFHLKPRIDREILAAHCKGLIALSACEHGEIARHIAGDDYRAALRASEDYADIMGRDNFFLEVQDHGTEQEKKVNEGMSRLAAETGLGLVATNNVHYIREEHADAHAVLMCLKSHTVMSDPNRPHFQGQGFHFKSAADMQASFSWAPHAVARTSEIAGRCDAQIRFGGMHFPAFPVPGGLTARSFLETLCSAGLNSRYGVTATGAAGTQREKEVFERARHELTIIERTGYANYFLVVQDFVQFARHSGIPVGVRGSGGSSLVAYALGITEIDPLRYNLVFERFLNPEEGAPPDFDIDFCQTRRAEVIRYLRGRYPGRVAHIASFSLYGGRVAIRDAARVLEISHKTSEEILQMMPDDSRTTLKLTLAKHPGLAMTCELDPGCNRLISCASVLEGLCRNAGTHAAGIVIGERDLSELVPLALDKDNQPITQYSMAHLGEIGLLKLDLLGLRTLTVIKETLDLVYKVKKMTLDLEQIPHDDPTTLHLLKCGNTIGVFQLESSGMRELLKRIGLVRMEDLIAVLALYRPGPVRALDDYVARKTGKTPPTFAHPLLRPVLEETFGVIVYEEQVIMAACVLAGYSPGQADLLRRTLGSKDVETIESHRGRFLKGCARKHRIPTDTANDIFDHLSRFSEHAFNKAHSVACSVLSYRTAHLKAHYPAEFMAALLSSEMGDTGKLQIYANEACAMGLRILPPHINESDLRFLPGQGGGIRCGLGAIRNIGESALEAILHERRTRGPYTGLTDFCVRTVNLSIHRKAIDILVRCGSFDTPLMHRARLYKGLSAAMSYAAGSQRDSRNGQVNLFDVSGHSSTGQIRLKDEDVMPDCEPWHESRLLADEKDLIGFYVSGHPLSDFAHVFDRYHLANVKTLAELQGSAKAITGGIISGIALKTTHQGATMASLRLDCLDGEIEVVVFPTEYSLHSGLLKLGSMIFVCGEIRREEPGHMLTLHASELCPLEEIHTRLAARVSIHIAATSSSDADLSRVRDVLHRHPGPVPVAICLEYPGGEKVFLDIGKGFKVMPDDSLIRELEQIVGEDGVYVAVKDHKTAHP